MSSFKLWLRYAKPARGRVTVDDGAERALRERGTSLLPVGVVEVEGDFEAGDAVEVRCDGRPVGKGIVGLLGGRAAPDQGAEDRRGAQAAAAGDRGGRAPRLLRAGLTLRSPYDREILRLAVPALGALAAEPLYLLADTAMVGHLGTEELAALAIAATLLTGAFTLFNFLTYGTTAQVARLSGAGETRRRRRAGGPGALAGDRHRALPDRRCSRAGGPAREPDGRRRPHGRAGRAVPAHRLAGAAVRADRARRPGLPARRVGPAHAARDRRGRQRGERRC